MCEEGLRGAKEQQQRRSDDIAAILGWGGEGGKWREGSEGVGGNGGCEASMRIQRKSQLERRYAAAAGALALNALEI
jgi:hypothetical protein